MAPEVTFALRLAYEPGHGIVIRSRVGLYLEGIFLAPITRNSPSD
jgi:hypothetical protein